jgi:hypothetical protein
MQGSNRKPSHMTSKPVDTAITSSRCGEMEAWLRNAMLTAEPTGCHARVMESRVHHMH